MSLRYVLFDLTLFSKGDDKHESRNDLLWMLEALTQRDQAYLKDHPETPLLYDSGVTYERPAQFQGECEEVQILRRALGPSANDFQVSAALETVQAVLGGERFRDIGRVIEHGSGDCDNLAAWRSAELRQQGIKASPYIVWRKRADGGYTYHVVVRWPDNTLEDPSLLLGMGGSARKADREEEIRKNAERVQMAKDAGKRKQLTSVVGHAPRQPRIPQQRMFVPSDEWGMVDLDRDFDESFDEAMLRHTGLMRGR